MSKIKVKISKTKYCSFYNTLSESIEQIAERAEWRGKENLLKRKEIGIRNIAKKRKERVR